MMTNTTTPLSLPTQNTSSSILYHLSATSILLFLATYILTVRYFRYARRDSMVKEFGYSTRESLKSMKNTDAQKIIGYLGELEFPTFNMISLQFALFKTYGIPTISRLLVETRQFSTSETASKRYADTGILIGEFTSHPPLHPRALKAISRMNYLHSSYQKSGKISNNDLLYTLSVFITEPVSWVKRFEWRAMNDMEVCAISTFWKSIGDAMGISYHVLQNWDEANGKGKWKDGLEFYTDIKQWAETYEKEFMVPNFYNKKTADELVPLLLFFVPKAFLPFARDVVGVLMGPFLRSSMKYPEPSSLSEFLTYTILNTRKMVIRHACLPRPTWMRVREISNSDDRGVNGRYNSMNYFVHPYYQKPGFWNRWGPTAMVTRVLGGVVPEEGKWKAEGYRFEEVGPERRQGKGVEEMERWEEVLGRERTASCPFAFGG
ncbi:hypothetical protein DID88_003965 [Monilinia fructigena]|uniref:Uncharacterized protein n=1 Tax=Monilinia fructigena TaxID=38457 RepID=A0A395IE03_9HELO|nr:hypothetical protein DID88_003965 [Monilinia fructigena]